MTKAKKSRQQESSGSDDDASNSSSSESSSSSSSSNDSDAKKDKSHKKAATKGQKVKKSRKRSSSSSSSDSDNSASNQSIKREKSSQKRKHVKGRDSEEESAQRKVKEEDKRGNARRSPDNRSKWDSPTRGREGHHRGELQERHRPEDSRERHHHDHSGSNRRQDRPKDDAHRDRDFDRGERNHGQDFDRDRRRDRGGDSRDYNRNANKDRNSNQQSDDRRGGYADRNRRDNNERDDRRRDDRDSRGERSNYDRRRRSFSRSPRRRFPRRRNDDDNSYEWGKRVKEEKDGNPPAEKEKPNFGLSGKLTEDTNKVNGVIIKYAEPLEARKPKRRWRLYPFKGEKALPTLYIHRQSCYLIGRDRKVCDLPVDHPSCSKQHAALQYRLVPFEREDGTLGKRVRPYLIDLESANGTFLNNKPIEPKKYFELIEKDVIKFGFSSREYVLLHENSKEDQMDDDVGPEDLQDVPIKEEPAG